MRYWVYINDKVEGPFEEEKLVTLQGFTPDTLICAEDAANGGNQEWAKASSIFEFDQVPVTQPAVQAAPAQTQPAQETAPAANAADEGLAALLIGKLDALTAQISGMQAKLDGMQTKLEEAVTAAQQARETARPAAATAYIPPMEDDHHNTITLTQHDLTPEVNEDALITNTASLVSKAEDIVAAANTTQNQTVDMLGPVDLGTSDETALGANGGEDLVLSSAMDSLYNAKTLEQSQEEKESTFQDLLTPLQVQKLAAQADTLKQKTATLDDALKAAEEKPAVNEEAKEAFLSELTGGTAPQENAIDQIIKEKEEEKKANTLKLAAGAAAIAAGAAAMASLGDDKKEESAQPKADPVTEEKPQTLDFNDNEAPALSIAPDAKQPEVKEEVLPASQMPADQPAPMQQPAAQPLPAATDMPSLDDVGVKEVTTSEEDKKEETMQELVPGAKTEQPDGVLITDADLKDAFTERDAQSEQTVEQLFGIDQTAAQPAQTEAVPAEAQEIPSLDALGQQTAAQPLPVGNPNDLTEIELKEGSTYLISDFVPPAQSDGNALPKELGDLELTNAPDTAKEEKTEAFTEIVSSTQQTEKPVPAAENAPADVTVSQVILENTIKTKRGATLDIKTVPMVPEPAQTERLQIDGLDDDINAQHDLKAADVKPAGKAKMLVGVLVALVLAALIYVMLAFMNLIPAQFNLLSSNKAQAEQMAAQQEQMNEMLDEEPQNVPQAAPQLPEATPLDAALAEVKNYPLVNGFTLQEFIEAKHPAAQNLITWDISTAVDPDNYSVLVKVPPENPQSFKISYRFNYNTVTKSLDPTISDAKNLLDSASQGMPAAAPQQPAPAL
ncbi:MAG: hypothetical protein PUK24_04310 [Elusimicrobia bacterium]|nr:hypothetical protein [Elusimicrobiota bacterium]MDY6039858.1 hypothetical protein [Elusimicrobiaceae bacterium]